MADSHDAKRNAHASKPRPISYRLILINIFQVSNMILYGIPNCNTVKKAQDWLKENKKPYDFHDFKKKGITAEKLNSWFKIFGWEKVINKNGLTFKKLTKEEQAEINSPEKAITYLLQNTSAIKRPIIEEDDSAIVLGFTEDAYKEKLGV